MSVGTLLKLKCSTFGTFRFFIYFRVLSLDFRFVGIMGPLPPVGVLLLCKSINKYETDWVNWIDLCENKVTCTGRSMVFYVQIHRNPVHMAMLLFVAFVTRRSRKIIHNSEKKHYIFIVCLREVFILLFLME